MHLQGNLWNTDVLIILSDIDGIFDKDPKKHKDGELIEEVMDVNKLEEEIDISYLALLVGV